MLNAKTMITEKDRENIKDYMVILRAMIFQSERRFNAGDTERSILSMEEIVSVSTNLLKDLKRVLAKKPRKKKGLEGARTTRTKPKMAKKHCVKPVKRSTVRKKVKR